MVLVFRRSMAVVRKAWILFVLSIAIGVALVVLLNGQPWVWGASGALLFISTLNLIYRLVLRHFSVYVLTNQRLRQVGQQGLFKKTVVDVQLSSIESISYEVPGLFGDIFKYGTMMIRTYVGDLRISFVSDPEMVYNELQGVVDKASSADRSAHKLENKD